MQTGEVGIEITQIMASASLESKFAAQLDALLRRTCHIARAMTVLSHSDYRGFGPLAQAHPPMRGWLTTSVCGDKGRVYGLLQLSDKSGGREFNESDETNIHELAALIGESLDALRIAARQPE